MKHVFGGMLLVAGTAIGAGMLALPVVTAAGGLIPAFFIYLCCWFFMTATGLLLVEICLKLPEGANLVTMAETYLKWPGKWAAWILYLFLFYSLSIAYISAGSGLLHNWFGIDLAIGQFLFVIVLGACVYRGALIVDRMNEVLMVGLILSYLGFVILGIPHIKGQYLEHTAWASSWAALPVVFTSFSYQGMVPTLTNYLQRNAKRVRLAIVGGTTLAFLIYLIWEVLILGIIPLEELETARALGQTAVGPLRAHVSRQNIVFIGQIFAFCAIATSFLGVTIGLFDFLADGLSLAKKGQKKMLIALLTFGPPLVISLIRPSLFLIALTFAGGIGCALLLGLLPTLMTWVARYRSKKAKGPVLLFGGKAMLIALILFTIFELVAEWIFAIRH